jgi:hypothetical protein
MGIGTHPEKPDSLDVIDREIRLNSEKIKVFLLLFLQKKKNLLFLKKKKQKNFNFLVRAS